MSNWRAFQFLGSEREDLGSQTVAGGVERRALFAFLSAGSGRFLRVQTIRAEAGLGRGRRMVVGGLSGASMRRDGSLAGEFFLEAINDRLLVRIGAQGKRPEGGNGGSH